MSVTTGGHFCTADADCAQATGTSVCDRVGRPVGARCKSVVAAGAGCAREWQPRPDVFACMADWNSYRCADVPPVVIRWGRVRGRQ